MTTWVEMQCTRCGQTRWPTLPIREPFVCMRCTAVLAGRNAVDPLRPALSEEQMASLTRARAARWADSASEIATKDRRPDS
jgi:hypothetical protein